MKVVILSGGLGLRFAEETELRPKPMIEIGGKPILWHIMKIYSHYGFNDFIICLGYKGYYVKEYFAHYSLHQSDVTFDFRDDNKKIVHYRNVEPWSVTLIDTGLNTLTGGRIKRIQKYIGEETFLMTYGDGVADINIFDLIDFHKKKGKYATLTSVMPLGRFGSLDIEESGNVISFLEKPKGDGSWINGGFFVLEPEIFNYIKDDSTIWEQEPLNNLVKDKQLAAYKHDGFWKPMDTLRDKLRLEEMWKIDAKWKIWD